ncbi:hypothetical protein CP965_01850 [Halarcobacter mediterraneus]|uniref:Cobalt ABC transporter permease n=1 Tax=Halarcobacter mediterraneus TaxID=2023153 RepID=A0A4Q1AVY1_9BACT|nr:hypothetical protein [Halarcobacter mediterraneus]RXK14215.1 hypothetical protein CP965_01850 [Halarcobacter mediterraneus]
MATFCKKKTIDYSIAFISLFFYSFFIATAKELSILWIIPIFVQALLLRVDILAILKKLLKVNLFIVLMVIVLFFEEKYYLALLIFIRANLILWFTLSFDFDGFKLYKALHNLKFSNKFSLIFFFTVKYIEILLSNAKRLIELLKIRGFKFRFSLETFKTYGELFAFLIYISINKMQKVEDVIRLRTRNNSLFPSQKIIIGKIELSLIFSILGVIFVYYIK